MIIAVADSWVLWLPCDHWLWLRYRNDNQGVGGNFGWSPWLCFCIILYCIVLYCIVLYCIALYCVVLCCVALPCVALHCIACIVLYCIVLHCIALAFFFITVLSSIVMTTPVAVWMYMSIMSVKGRSGIHHSMKVVMVITVRSLVATLSVVNKMTDEAATGGELVTMSVFFVSETVKVPMNNYGTGLTFNEHTSLYLSCIIISNFIQLTLSCIIFGWPPCQRSDMIIMEVSQHTYNSLCIRFMQLFVYLKSQWKHVMVLASIFVELIWVRFCVLPVWVDNNF